MKKFYALGLTLVAVLAFSAVAAASAFAVSEWLIDGAAVGAATASVTEGLLILANESFGTALLDCEGILDGTVGPGATDSITALLTLGGVLIPGGQNLTASEPGFLTTGTGLDCLTTNSTIGCGATGSLAEVWPENLPWTSTIILNVTVFEDDLFNNSPEMEPAYDVICVASGISSLCEGLALGTLENMAAENDVLVISNPATLQPCSVGTGFEEGEGLISVPGKVLAVS